MITCLLEGVGYMSVRGSPSQITQILLVNKIETRGTHDKEFHLTEV